MGSREGQHISRGRKIAVAAAMAGAASVVAHSALDRYTVEWDLLAFAVIMGMAGIGMTRRSLVPQIVSRAAAWVVLGPSLLIVLLSLNRHMTMDLRRVAALAAGTVVALLCARPMLHTKEAREAFAPKAFRRWFLAGSTAMAAIGFVTGAIALDVFAYHGFKAAAFAALTASLFASAIAVVRMRGWGILLGALTSVVLLVSAGFMHRASESTALALAAAPSLLLHLLPVLVARMRSTTTSQVRLGRDAAHAYAPTRYRIAETSSGSPVASLGHSTDALHRDTPEPEEPRVTALRV